MTLSWGAKSIKYLLFVFNLLFFITGIIILSIGVSVKAYYVIYENILDGQYFSAANLLIAIGIIIFIISFFGCCGAIKNSYCMLITFSTLLVLIFVLLLAAGIAGYALKDQTINFLSSKMLESMDYYNSTHPTEVTKLWDGMQQDFQCCGVHNSTDWVKHLHTVDGAVPVSCCSTVLGAVGYTNCTEYSNNLFTDGCLESFGHFVKANAATIGGVGIGFALMMVLAIAASCYLSSRFRGAYDNM